ncbi:hypothetical protein [uncultured Clostridium sp.]|uniref:hypothetical protein n=1 Tax=uncultured Clostridium sp. TaxID=59620 RepID=UPI00260009FA|nr:hypothetical protein [uncultured Clostridium sp.]
MNIKELKEQLSEGTFYYYKFGLLVKGKVKMILQSDDNTLNVSFEGGTVDVYADTIKSIRRPGNIIAKFKWCYMLKNYYDDCIGYIGHIEDQ